MDKQNNLFYISPNYPIQDVIIIGTYQLGGKSNIIYDFRGQKLLENKRIADESIKLLLENNPREEGYDLKNGILKLRPK